MKHFYLSVFALLAPAASCAGNPKTDSCPISSKSLVGDACASYATLERLNAKIKPAVDDLTRTTDYFSHYRLNLFNKKCPFWDEENGFCSNIGCAVETLDNEEDVPEVWRAKELSKLIGPRAKHPGKKARIQNPDKPLRGELGDDVGESCVVEDDDECDDRDYCVPEDENDTVKGDYVSLTHNPERFTGYSGESAWQVWNAIYSENCFAKSSFPHSANLGQSSSNVLGPAGPAEQDFKQILSAAGRHAQLQQWGKDEKKEVFVPNTAYEGEDQCLEKRVFYRVISGMHASISAHLCWDFLNQSTGEWQPNAACYKSRLHDHPERISNLYFNYALITRAIAKLGPYLQRPEYTFCTGDASEDAATRAKVLEVTGRAASVPQTMDESLMFVNGEGPSLKEDFRNRFRNVSRMMDCVGCDKCRLWGKVQTAGYGTALKVLFEFDNSKDDVALPPLKRTEIVALFNTYARVSNSLHAIGKFRTMIEGVEEETVVDEVDEDDGWPEDVPESGKEETDPALAEFIARRKKNLDGAPVKEVFNNEFTKVLLAFKVVIKTWFNIPSAIWNIFTSETKRLYQFWVGLPVSPRSWRFALPDLDREDL